MRIIINKFAEVIATRPATLRDVSDLDDEMKQCMTRLWSEADVQTRKIRLRDILRMYHKRPAYRSQAEKSRVISTL